MAATSVAPAPAGNRAAAGRTTTAVRARAGGPVFHARLAAVVTAVSCATHLWLAATGNHGAWLSALMLVLAAVCVPCAVHIWRHSGVAALHQVTVAAVAMAAVHAALLLGGGGAGHAHTGGPPSSAAHADGAGGLLLVIALELATALLAATLVARLRRRCA
ncbi:hypothetical protein [Arthrobacter sp. SLBN-112]|uniref:hypothetical protein n=1 Tax=Arthrobacter sp. SLBN-112 TaxID=2768452 RepID=UPI0027B6BE0B|nr:hypothetical protein [Arthrobacter sp. SLBN-112]MDQ0799529.1 hypothetical protein [Arthrobacter sp. SLBN-112]